MTTRLGEIAVKQRLEIEDIVAKIMRLMLDLPCEEKRMVVTEVDRLVGKLARARRGAAVLKRAPSPN